jgi:AcrR family transcriptional regulator
MSNEKRHYQLKERARRQEETRRRIAEATAALHEEVGPAKTTVAEVARRAGVQRPTVYNNFPRERELFAACQEHFIAEHPPPDFSPSDPPEHMLRELYAWYRETEAMTGNVQRDRRLLPELDAVLAETSDRQLDALADGLAGGRKRARALARLALDFSTWKRLTSEGLSDREAANAMAAAVLGSAR